MRILSIVPLLALVAVFAGCAQTRTAMGAGTYPDRFYCRDGAWASTGDACVTHGGVERDTGQRTQ